MSDPVTVSISAVLLTGQPLPNARVRFERNSVEVDGAIVVPQAVSVTLDASGMGTADLLPNVTGQTRVIVTSAAGALQLNTLITVPDVDCDLHDLVPSNPPASGDTATVKAGEAAASAAEARADRILAQEALAEIVPLLAEAESVLVQYAAALRGTSSTSVAIGTGSKSFTASTGKQWAVGMFLLVASDADAANYMHGQVTAYNGTTGALTVLVSNIGGSGTYADWGISVSGSRGAVGAGGSFPAVTGETGILDYSYPVGDVRRYGVTPDGVTNWEGSFASRVAAIFANSCLAGVTIYWPPGEYATGLNLTSAYVGSKMYFDHAKFFNILHVIDNVTDVQWLGTVYTYDRLGTIGSRLRFGTVILLNDATKNPQGTGNRGVHILGGEDISWDDIIVENTGPTSSVLPGAQTIWAAFTAQGNPRNLRGHSIWVKNAQGHGVYINAYDVNIGLIKVDGYGNQAIDFTGASYLQDSDSEAQSEQGCGVWLNRWTGYIGRIVVGQSNATPADDMYSVLVDETGKSTSAADRYVTGKIGSIRASVGGNRGICFGEATTPGNFLNVDVDTITAQLRSGTTMTSGYAMVNVSPVSSTTASRYAVKIGHIDMVDPNTQLGVKATGTAGTRVFTEVNIGVVSADNMLGAGQMCVFDGSAGIGSLRGSVGRIHCKYDAGSGSNPMVDLNTVQSFAVGSVHLKSNSAVNTPAIRMLNCTDTQVRNVRTENFRNTGAGTVAINGVTRCVFGPAYLKGAATSGQGILFSNAITDLSLVDVRVTGFATGLDNGTGLSMSGVSAVNCRSYSNTDDTDLTTTNIPAASQFNCSGITV